ncbi:MAG: hypothetical protein WBS20_06745 [Lysobacterales bacterium]
MNDLLYANQTFRKYSVAATIQDFFDAGSSGFFLIESTIPKIINIMPIPINELLIAERKILGSKKSTPASIQSIGANL